MEQDRFQQNSKVFIFGLISLLLSLSLFAFSFYIMPYLLWTWSYSVPGIVIIIREWYIDTFQFTNSGASWMVFLSFLIPAMICGYLSQLSSNYIDNEIYGIKKNETKKDTEVKKDIQETLGFSLKIFLLIAVVFAIVLMMEWLIATPTI